MVSTRRSSVAGRKKCLVTGGAGFLGKHLVEQLLASGKYEVVIFDIRDAGDARVTSIVGDLRKPEQVQAAVAGAHTIFCQAAWYDSHAEDCPSGTLHRMPAVTTLPVQ